MNKSDEGFILLDTVIALFILSVTLISIYSLVIKSLDFENKITTHVEKVLEENNKYEMSFAELLQE